MFSQEAGQLTMYDQTVPASGPVTVTVTIVAVPAGTLTVADPVPR